MKKHFIFLHISVFLAGFTGILGKLITLNEGLLTWYRLFFASIILFFLVLFTHKSELTRLKGKLPLILVGFLLSMHWVLFYGSVKYANVSVGVVCFALSGFFTAILAPIINRTKFQKTEFALGLLTVFGIGLIFHFDATYHTGIIIGVISACMAALFTIFSEKLVHKHHPFVLNFYELGGGLLGLSLVMPLYMRLFPTDYIIPNQSDTIYLLILSLACTVGLYILFAEALKGISAFTASLTYNLEPVYSILLAFLLFNEAREVNVYFFVGLFFVILSVALQSIIAIRKRKKLAAGM